MNGHESLLGAYDRSQTPTLIQDAAAGLMLYANSAACAYYGYASQDFKALNPLALYTPVAQPYMMAHFGNQASGEVWDFRTLQVMAGGATREVQMSTTAIVWQDRPAQLVCVLDVARENLTVRSVPVYQRDLPNMLTPVLVIDKATRLFIDVNEAACTYYGYSRAKLLSMGPIDLHTTEEAQGLTHQFALIQSLETTSFETTHMKADGTSTSVHLTLTTIPWNDGPACLVIVTDINEREALFLVGQRGSEELAESEARYRRVFEDNLVPMVVCHDQSRSFIDVNQAACAYYGYARSEFLELTLLDWYPVDEHAQLRKDLSGKKCGKADSFDATHLKGDGSSTDVRVSVLPIMWRQAPARLITIHDLSERNAAVASIRASNEAFTRAQNIGKFGHWTFDLRTFATYWSDGLFTIFGQPKEHGIPPGEKPHRAFFAPEDFAKIEELQRLTMLGVVCESLDVELIRPDGSTVWIRQDMAADFDHNNVAIKLSGTVHDISAHKDVEAQLSAQARVDALTGLPNRNGAAEAMRMAVTSAERTGLLPSILFIDINDFKRVNDTVGHSAGDALLVELSKRLRSALRRFDFLARMGGDEFLVILSDVADPSDAAMVAEQVQTTINRPIELNSGQSVVVTASIGIALYPQDGTTAEMLIMNSDTAMYHAKREQNATYRFFSAEMHAAAEEKLLLDIALRAALDANGFVLHYQPIVAARGGIVGCEALVRWPQTDGRTLLPTTFIPYAEESGLILALGKWVLTTACAQGAKWNSVAGTPLRMSVNVSARQIAHPAFLDIVLEALESSGLAPELLELEFTETTVARVPEQSREVAARLRAAGVRISLDDFGTGYNSLVNLRTLEIDTLKLDKCFVDDIADNSIDRAIATSVISAARSLGATPLAEGVETVAQSKILASLGIDEMQGYLYARPMNADDMGRFLALNNGNVSTFDPMVAA